MAVDLLREGKELPVALLGHINAFRLSVEKQEYKSENQSAVQFCQKYGAINLI